MQIDSVPGEDGEPVQLIVKVAKVDKELQRVSKKRPAGALAETWDTQEREVHRCAGPLPLLCDQR